MKFLEKNIGRLITLILGVIVIINMYPKILLGGDIEGFMIFPKAFISKSLYIWFQQNAFGGVFSNVHGILVYSFGLLLHTFFGYTIANYIFYICMYVGAFWSAYLLIKGIFRNYFSSIIVPNYSLILIALLYICNLHFTVLNYRGIHTELLSFILIPLGCLWLVYIMQGKNKYLVLLFFLSILLSNIAHFLVFFVTTSLILGLELFYGNNNFFKVIKRYVLFICITILTSLYGIIPLGILFSSSYNSIKGNAINTNQVINGEIYQQQKYHRIRNSLANLNQVYLTEGHHGMSILDVNQYGILYYIPLLLFIGGFFFITKRNKNQYSYFFGIYLLLVLILTGAGGPIADQFIYFITKFPGGGVFRAVYSKFNYVMLINQLILVIILFSEIASNFRNKLYLFIIILPFLNAVSYGFLTNLYDKKFVLTNLPSDYVREVELLQSNIYKANLKNGFTLPHTNLQRQSFTKWGFRGYSLLKQGTSNAGFHDLGSVGFSNGADKLYDTFINIPIENISLHTLQKYGYDFLIIQKDFKYNFNDYYNFVDQNNAIEIFLDKNREKISIIQDNKYFTVYKIHNLPSVTLSHTSIVIGKFNPTQYRLSLTIPSNSTGEDLRFLQSFHKEWKLYPGKPFTCSGATQEYNNAVSDIEMESVTENKETGSGQAITYIARAGDTLYRIARKYSLDLDTLESYNPTVKENFKVGQQFIVGYTGTELTSNNIMPVDQTTGSITTECVNSSYTFFQGEELSYLWKQPLRDESHSLMNEYANGREIDIKQPVTSNKYAVETYLEQGLREGRIHKNTDESYQVDLVLYFRPQSWFYLGLLISGLTLLSLLGWLGWSWVREKKVKVL